MELNANYNESQSHTPKPVIIQSTLLQPLDLSVCHLHEAMTSSILGSHHLLSHTAAKNFRQQENETETSNDNRFLSKSHSCSCSSLRWEYFNITHAFVVAWKVIGASARLLAHHLHTHTHAYMHTVCSALIESSLVVSRSTVSRFSLALSMWLNY